MTHHAQCACGTVRIEADGAPDIQCYCHCTSCRQWSGQPVTACLLWPEAAVRIVAGADKLHRYSRDGDAEGGRFSCTVCGGALCSFIVRTRQYDIFGGALRDFTFAPTLHINDGERVLSIPDGLPKFRDMPASAGGTGEKAAE